jgi:hypothetical protein
MDPSTDLSTHTAVPPLYGLDIETDTSVDGLDPAHAAVVAVGLATPAGDEVFLGDEGPLLARLDRRLRELPAGVLVTWNGASFDLPFLAARAASCSTPIDLELWAHPDDAAHVAADGSPWPPPPLGFGARWGAHGHLDGYRTFRADVRRSLGLSCGLKAMARLVGLVPVEVDYERLHTLSRADLATYVASDARLACVLVARRGPAALAAVDRPGAPPVALTGRRTGDDDPVATLPSPAAG